MGYEMYNNKKKRGREGKRGQNATTANARREKKNNGNKFMKNYLLFKILSKKMRLIK